MFSVSDVLDASFTARSPAQLWPLISPLCSVDEAQWLKRLLPLASPSVDEAKDMANLAATLIKSVRAHDEGIHKIDALLLEYSLDTKEGVLLMCLAEALLRVPDAQTADALIEDKLGGADWADHLGKSDSFFANVSTWGLMVTGKVVTLDAGRPGEPAGMIAKMVDRVSEPVIRKAMKEAMKIMGRHFVLGRTINEALKRARPYRDKGASFSFDMLGEAALTTPDALNYYAEYARAIKGIGHDKYNAPSDRLTTISIKLSALHPRYESAQKTQAMDVLYERVLSLATLARGHGVGITIDAEEAGRLELSLELFEKLYRSAALAGWGELGIVVQAYSKRALAVLAWVTSLAKSDNGRIPLRLVKGAYWDAEIKHAQQGGYDGYPVYTRKEGTDTAYLACTRFLLSDAARGYIYPQFATHNAHTVAAVRIMAEGAGNKDYEFQRLNGMGDALYDSVISEFDVNVCVYAPVGSHKDLLAYLVRRLLENGANSSFVHRLIDGDTPIENLTRHPAHVLTAHEALGNPLIPLPRDIFAGQGRINSAGENLDVESEWAALSQRVSAFDTRHWIAGQERPRGGSIIYAPHNKYEKVGTVYSASPEQIDAALNTAQAGYAAWENKPVTKRAACLTRLADLLETHRAALISLCQREAGKTWQDAIDEVREAVDFCRYYAVEGQRHENPKNKARGIFVCISPWNFPLAITLGQICAALMAGNSVIAKPAEQTSLIAALATQLIYQAGVPKAAFICLYGGGEVGAALTSDVRVAGVAFTGSTRTARAINRSLAGRDCDPAVLIAETGGQNAMIIDSTSLPEQVVADVVRSAFASAGQRCSALRVLYVQSDIASKILPLLEGAMAELVVGDPRDRASDCGPVIDRQAQSTLLSHIADMREAGALIAQSPLSKQTADSGTYIAPIAFKISAIDILSEEHFGPVLHVIIYESEQLGAVIDAINASGFGLTLGVQSRNEATCQRIAAQVKAGNIYINRDQVGAVVGVQPFGGRGLSGTGPKAGGPHYLPRFQIGDMS